jgi:hypothetical protein
MDHSIDPQIAEECMHEVVDCIRKFVDGLREEFPVPSQQGRLVPVAPNPNNHLALPLYTRMVERGVLEQVQRAVKRQRKEWKDLEVVEELSSGPTSISPSSSATDQRAALLQEICLPTLRSLAACYRILDAIPQMPPDDSSSPVSAKNRKENKPPPPRGMLSIQQYTDVACLCEFIVCTAILPVLDPRILASIDDRMRHHLPKSLAGRLPRVCLAWGASQQLSKSGCSSQDDDLLLETASAVSELILLDRFRPMLLPRHIADLYAAIFQHENNQGLTSSSRRIQQGSVLYQSLGLQGIAVKSKAPAQILDDASLQAKAYQTLLLQGTKTPSWVRQRVAPLLTELACTNLASIVQVFVPLQQQHGEVSTMASQRLGQTLATSSASTAQYTQRLGRQMRLLLEALFSTVGTEQIPARAMAILQTIWAVLYHWPSELVQQELIRPWQQGLLQGGDEALRIPSRGLTIHKTLRQIGSLCASVPPPATNPWIILQHLFQTSSGPIEFHTSVMNQLVRIATMRSVVKSLASEEARQILHWLCQATAMSNTTTMEKGGLPSGLTLLASAWVHALVPTEWDKVGLSYKLVVSTEETNNSKEGVNKAKSSAGSLEMIEIRKGDLPISDISSLVEQIQGLSDVFFETCLAEEDAPIQGPTKALQGLSSLVFRLLLKLYLSGSQLFSSTSIQLEWVYQLVAIVVLPNLFEKCSPEALLFGPGSGTNALGLLHSIKMILTCTKARLCQNETLENSLEDITTVQDNEPTSKDINDDDAIMIRCLKLLIVDESFSSTDDSPVNMLPLLDEKEQDDTLLSIASIVLSLLIAVLELGSKLRSDGEEEALQSFLPILSILAGFSSQDHTPSGVANHGTNAGISDMAGYALALIASRNAQITVEAPKAALSTMDKVRAMIQEAQEDLKSTQPPIRARGMVSLGRLARGYLGILKPQDRKPKLIEELGDGSSLVEESVIDFTIREVLRLSIDALSDDESYVYLAAIQAIVAAGDLQPKQVLPRLGAAIVTGRVDVEVHGSSISNEQRIKLAEALMFIIRRRAAPAEFLPQLINLMIFGSVDTIGAVNKDTSGDYHRRLFAQETNRYFLGGVDDEDTMIGSNNNDKWEDQDVRSKTGGPVFAVEEHDLVRSMRLSVIAELASVVPPASLVPFCRLLIRLIADVLRLETSRTVCRAAALLAREFYGSLLREQDELSLLIDDRKQHGDAPLQLAVAIISNENEEAVLIKTLENHCSGNVSFAGAGRGIDDPAVAARSQEALALREDGEDILEAARLVTNATQQNGDLPSILTSIIKSPPPASIGNLQHYGYSPSSLK